MSWFGGPEAEPDPETESDGEDDRGHVTEEWGEQISVAAAPKVRVQVQKGGDGIDARGGAGGAAFLEARPRHGAHPPNRHSLRPGTATARAALGPDLDMDASSSGSEVGGWTTEGPKFEQCKLAGSQQIATHAIIRVNRVSGVPRELAEAPTISMGRHGLAHFLDSAPADHVTVTVSAVRLHEKAPFAPSKRRCAVPRMPLRETHDAEFRDAFWEDGEPGEARIRLKPGEVAIRAGLVLGTEVVALTRPINLGGTMRRFFQAEDLRRPGALDVERAMSRVGVVGSVRVAIELWPPGALPPPGAEPDPALERDGDPRLKKRGCGFCDGQGRKMCDGCGGHGALVCKACDGMPPLPCQKCRGTGRLQRNMEVVGGGGGVVVSAGGQRCTACYGSPITCEACFGMMSLRCHACSGAGWTPCLRCAQTSGSVWV